MMVAILAGALIEFASFTGGCFAASRELPAGSVLSAGDVVVSPCRPVSKRVPLRYDRLAGAPVAAAVIPAGTYLGRLAPLAQVRIEKGQRLTLRSASGPVVIEREVVAMQSGAPGGRVFVSDASGRVFSVRVGEIR